jgi:hypothetical protein
MKNDDDIKDPVFLYSGHSHTCVSKGIYVLNVDSLASNAKKHRIPLPEKLK